MTAPTDERPRDGQPAVRRRIIAAVVAVTAVVVLILAFIVVSHLGRDPREPSAFEPAYGGVNETTDGHPGVPSWVGMSFPVPRPKLVTVHIDKIQARTAVNTADARVSFLICSNIQQPGPGTVAVGTLSGGIGEFCSTLVPAKDVDLTLGRGHFESIVMKVVATHPGRVRVNGIDVSYSLSGQTATQWTGHGVVVYMRPSSTP